MSTANPLMLSRPALRECLLITSPTTTALCGSDPRPSWAPASMFAILGLDELSEEDRVTGALRCWLPGGGARGSVCAGRPPVQVDEAFGGSLPGVAGGPEPSPGT